MAELLTDVEPVSPAMRSPRPRPIAAPSESGSQWGNESLVEQEELHAVPAPVLNEKEHSEIQRFIVEREQAERLRLAGVAPSSSLLLSGPPGVGKTMTAFYLAAATGLPLLRLRTGALMSGLLGQSARNLMEVLNVARSAPSLLLLDEFDAYARRRDDALDIAEPKRLVNTLLVELERWPDDCVVIAATNHAELLDLAVERRFDLRIELRPPTEKTRRRLLREHLAAADPSVDDRLLSAAAHATEGWTGSDLAAACRAAQRRGVLDAISLEGALAEVLIRDRLAGRSAEARKARQQFVHFAAERLSMSQRDIGELIGVSHVTVGDILRGGPKAG